ncbi:hypothetical protein KDH_72320 [Dictyobacter sp. S3.2.2.5]|uniref:Peptidase M10 metallopeptidase domain-containing protein n=1 Tax=Dictyobacter halimunensis TaxID=3026934 RepID=A0ABQ6G1K6_9CHLR|nr:hypothetical protein KDH_72320 [Dictyobacter sp. S3.2.2.5]
MRWGVCIVTLVGVPRGTSMPVSWFNQVFSDSDGVASYFQQMSGGRQSITWQVFGPIDLLTPSEKQALDMKGAEAVVEGLRTKATAQKIPVTQFDRFIWILDEGISTSGTTPSDSLVGAIDFTPQLAAHEMTHAFGVGPHADRYTATGPQEYADPFCVMGRGNTARSFANPRLTLLSANYTHDTTGPGICAPYLYVAKWLDYQKNVEQLETSAMDQNAGGAIITLNANQGAPGPGRTERIALTIGTLPTQANGQSQYWIEYRHPSAFDRGVDRPVSTTTPDLPPEGALVLHDVRFDAARNSLHSYLISWVGANGGSVLDLPASGYQLRVTSTDTTGRRVFLALEHKFTSFPLQARVSALARLQNHLDLFTVGNDDAVYSTWWDGASNSGRWDHGWFRISDPNFADGFTVSQRSVISAIARHPNHLDLFVIGKDDVVYSTWWDGTWDHGWFRIGDANFSDGFTVNQSSTISVVSRFPEHLDLFVVGKNDAIYSTWWDGASDGGKWDHGWFSISDPNFPDGFTINQGSAITAISRRSDHLDLFVIGKNDAIYSTWWDGASDGGKWDHGWFSISDPNFPDSFTVSQSSTISVVSRFPEHMDLFVVGKNDAIYSTWWDGASDGGKWDHGWFSISDPNFPDGFTVNQGTVVSAIARFPEHLDLFVVGKDGAIYSTWWDANADGGRWSHGWFRIADPNFPDNFTVNQHMTISVVSRFQGHLDLFVVGKDGYVYSTWWDANTDGGRWSHGWFRV